MESKRGRAGGRRRARGEERNPRPPPTVQLGWFTNHEIVARMHVRSEGGGGGLTRVEALGDGGGVAEEAAAERARHAAREQVPLDHDDPARPRGGGGRGAGGGGGGGEVGGGAAAAAAPPSLPAPGGCGGGGPPLAVVLPAGRRLDHVVVSPGVRVGQGRGRLGFVRARRRRGGPRLHGACGW